LNSHLTDTPISTNRKLLIKVINYLQSLIHNFSYLCFVFIQFQNSRMTKLQKQVPIHLKLKQLETSLTQCITTLCERVTILENLILTEFGNYLYK